MKPTFRSAFAGFSGFSFAAHTPAAPARKPTATVSQLPHGKSSKAKLAKQPETVARAEAA